MADRATTSICLDVTRAVVNAMLPTYARIRGSCDSVLLQQEGAMNVLIVDDQQSARDLMRIVLQEMSGLSILDFENPIEALHWTDRFCPD